MPSIAWGRCLVHERAGAVDNLGSINEKTKQAYNLVAVKAGSGEGFQGELVGIKTEIYFLLESSFCKKG